jgi:hypothetical protein
MERLGYQWIIKRVINFKFLYVYKEDWYKDKPYIPMRPFSVVTINNNPVPDFSDANTTEHRSSPIPLHFQRISL